MLEGKTCSLRRAFTKKVLKSQQNRSTHNHIFTYFPTFFQPQHGLLSIVQHVLNGFVAEVATLSLAMLLCISS